MIQNPVKENDIATLKLVNGDELVAKIVSIDQHSNITITKPLSVNISMDPQTQRVGIQMIPTWLLTGDPAAHVTISKQHIITYTLANDAARSNYIKNTSGLEIPTSGLV